MFEEFSSLGTANSEKLREMPEEVKARELVRRVREDRDAEALRELYQLRRDYFRYPIIHSGIRSTSFLGDLHEVLSLDAMSTLIPSAVELAEEETEAFFGCSLYLLNMLSDGVFRLSERSAIEDRLIALRPRAQRVSFYPNIRFWWNLMIGNLVDGPVSTHAIECDDWQQDPANALSPIPGDTDHALCPMSPDQVQEKARCGNDSFRFEFVRNGICRGNRYWFWLNRNLAEGPIRHCYVYVVQTQEGTHRLQKYSMHSTVHTSPEKLALLDVFGIAAA